MQKKWGDFHMSRTDKDSAKAAYRRVNVPMTRAQHRAKARREKRHRRMMVARFRQGILLLILIVASVLIIKLLMNVFSTPDLPHSDKSIDLVPTDDSITDTVAPVIQNVKPMIVYVGDAVSYRKGISVSDETDPAPNLEIDTSKVDLTQPGTYPVVYISKDKSGNTSSQETTIEVRAHKDGYVSSEQIMDTADSLLHKIIKDDMSKKEKVKAVYTWLRKNCAYGGHSDRGDYMQTAYSMLTQKRGDCYGYFAAAKLLFERMGIDNLDVQKVKNNPTDSNHFWSLVSLDDGKTWYHFDATPRRGDGDDFCLVTDAFLDAYSTTHKNSHNRDKSLYPATPEH